MKLTAKFHCQRFSSAFLLHVLGTNTTTMYLPHNCYACFVSLMIACQIDEFPPPPPQAVMRIKKSQMLWQKSTIFECYPLLTNKCFGSLLLIRPFLFVSLSHFFQGDRIRSQKGSNFLKFRPQTGPSRSNAALLAHCDRILW